jgi:hypothetical protein
MMHLTKVSNELWYDKPSERVQIVWDDIIIHSHKTSLLSSELDLFYSARQTDRSKALKCKSHVVGDVRVRSNIPRIQLHDLQTLRVVELPAVTLRVVTPHRHLREGLSGLKKKSRREVERNMSLETRITKGINGRLYQYRCGGMDFGTLQPFLSNETRDFYCYRLWQRNL